MHPDSGADLNTSFNAMNVDDDHLIDDSTPVAAAFFDSNYDLPSWFDQPTALTPQLDISPSNFHCPLPPDTILQSLDNELPIANAPSAAPSTERPNNSQISSTHSTFPLFTHPQSIRNHPISAQALIFETMSLALKANAVHTIDSIFQTNGAASVRNNSLRSYNIETSPPLTISPSMLRTAPDSSAVSNFPPVDNAPPNFHLASTEINSVPLFSSVPPRSPSLEPPITLPLEPTPIVFSFDEPLPLVVGNIAGPRQSRLGPIPSRTFSLGPPSNVLPSHPVLPSSNDISVVSEPGRFGPIPSRQLSLGPPPTVSPSHPLLPRLGPIPSHTFSLGPPPGEAALHSPPSSADDEFPNKKPRYWPVPDDQPQPPQPRFGPIPARSISLGPPPIMLSRQQPSDLSSSSVIDNTRYGPIPDHAFQLGTPPSTANHSPATPEAEAAAANFSGSELVQLCLLPKFQEYGQNGLEDVIASYYVAGAVGALHGKLNKESLDPQTYIQSRRLASQQPTDRSLEIARSAMLPVMWDLAQQMQTHSHRLKSLRTRKQLLLTCLNTCDEIITNFDECL